VLRPKNLNVNRHLTFTRQPGASTIVQKEIIQLSVAMSARRHFLPLLSFTKKNKNLNHHNTFIRSRFESIAHHSKIQSVTLNVGAPTFFFKICLNSDISTFTSSARHRNLRANLSRRTFPRRLQESKVRLHIRVSVYADSSRIASYIQFLLNPLPLFRQNQNLSTLNISTITSTARVLPEDRIHAPSRL
jgi:hypothetical protein